MTTPSRCPGCGEPLNAGDRFCGGCGADVTASAPGPAVAKASAPGPSAAKSPLNRTMMGMSPQLSPGPAAGGQAKAMQRTMLGVSPPEPQVAVPMAARQPEPANAQGGASPKAGKGDLKRTLLGVSPVDVAGLKTPGLSPPAQVAKPLTPSSPEAQAASAVGQQPAPPQAGAPEKAKPKLTAKSSRTMLGISPFEGAPSQPSMPSEHAQDPVASAAEHSSPAPRQRSFTPVSTPIDPDLSEPPSSEGVTPRRAFWLGLVAMAAALLLGGLSFWLAGGEPSLHARVIERDGAEILEIEAPSAPPGTKVRFSGVETELKAGRVEFVLAEDSLALGDNRLPLSLVEPDGDVDATVVKLDVDYRARLDVSGLAHDPPSVSVVIDALSGTKVTVEGQALPLNDKGRATRDFPLEEQSGSLLSFQAGYALELPDGEHVEGTLALKLPVTALHIDRPGMQVVTDQASVEVAGAVDPGASVELNGEPVKVVEGRFLKQVTLEEQGDHTLRIVARTADKAPRALEVRVRRVKDLSVAAASFVFDKSLTYAKIQQNPVIYQGQSVAFDGRVYNVEVEAGRSVLQILVEKCPRGARCPLWVEHEQAVDATVDSWVRVLGTVLGEQKFRSRKGNVQTVPALRAQYVLKLAR